jgi:lipopolysaccharide/colanic/teichoic acid biosynthesis glycosyltransferase
MAITRIFDVVFAILGLVILSPILVIVAILIKTTSQGKVFFPQVRVGQYGKDFKVLKFRTMYNNSDKKGLLTVGGNDNRITKIGYYLRKYKLDELPQLINVLKGEMSIVGPRPEVRKYVDLYTNEQKKVLDVLPGITDYASIAFRNENELLALVDNPEEYYIKELIPKKSKLSFKYINNQSLLEYFSIIQKTVVSAIRGR